MYGTLQTTSGASWETTIQKYQENMGPPVLPRLPNLPSLPITTKPTKTKETSSIILRQPHLTQVWKRK